MAVTFIGSAAANANQTVILGNATVVVPSAAQAGDVAVFAMTQNTGVATFTAPAGWTPLRTAPDGVNNNLQVQVWKKQLVVADVGSSVTFQSDVSARLPGILLVYRGALYSQVITGAPTAAATAVLSHASPAVTTTVNETGVVNIWALRVATAAPSADLTVPGTQTLDRTVKTAFTSTPNYTLVGSHRTTPAVAGTYASQTGTSSALATSVVFTVTLPPATTSSGTPPVASFTLSPRTGPVPLSVTFTNTSTGTGNSYLWDFGDNSTSTSTSPVHSYASPGTYTVRLVATNASGADDITDIVQPVDVPVTTGGMNFFVLRSGVWKPAAFYFNLEGAIESRDWFREAAWNRSTPWGPH
jgi:hypothetical protein